MVAALASDYRMRPQAEYLRAILLVQLDVLDHLRASSPVVPAKPKPRPKPAPAKPTPKPAPAKPKPRRTRKPTTKG